MRDKWRGDGGSGEEAGTREGGREAAWWGSRGGKLAPRQRHVEMAAAEPADDGDVDCRRRR